LIYHPIYDTIIEINKTTNRFDRLAPYFMGLFIDKKSFQNKNNNPESFIHKDFETQINILNVIINKDIEDNFYRRI